MRTITKITENDLKAALDLHAVSGVCKRALKEFNEQGVAGKKNEFCVMGLIAGGVARNRHISFDDADYAIDSEGNCATLVKLAAGLEQNPVVMNDSFENMGALKQWQGGVLRRLLKSVQKNGPIELEQ